MSILSQADRTRRICMDAVMVAVAMMLSYLEVLIPFDLLIPLPGFRLGLANAVVMLLFTLVSPIDAAIVSSLRVLLMGILFGTATSLYFSAAGAVFAFLMLILTSKILHRASYIGASVLCAAAHNLGQILAASTLFGADVILYYYPWLLLASVIFGTAIGILLNILSVRVRRLLE